MTIQTINGFQIPRNNTLLVGYMPIVREVEGLMFLVQGTLNITSGFIAPITNERAGLLGRAQLVDGIINIMFSPVIITVGVIAIAYLELKK